jgi:hypothetical protein
MVLATVDHISCIRVCQSVNFTSKALFSGDSTQNEMNPKESIVHLPQRTIHEGSAVRLALFFRRVECPPSSCALFRKIHRYFCGNLIARM